MQRFWRAETGFFLGLWLLLAIVGRSSLFQDPGTFWHTAVGRQIVETGRVPRVDSLSFTFAERPWVATQWLAEVVMAAVYDRLGWDGLLLLTVTLLAGLLTFVAHRLLCAGLHVLPTVMVVTIVAAASSHHFHARPHVATLLFVTILMALLADVESGKRSIRSLWCCLPLFVLWTNLHGGALAGFGMLLIAAAGWLTWKLLRWESPLGNRSAMLHMAGVVVVCGAALVASPYGLDTPRTWLRVMSLDLPDLIEEHAPLSLSRPEGAVTLMIAIGYLAMLLSTWPKRPRVVWLLPLLWAYLAVGRVRHAPLFALTAVIAAADMLPHSRLAIWFKSKEWWHDASAPTSISLNNSQHKHSAVYAWLLPIALVLLAVSLQYAKVDYPVIGRGWARLDPRVWPVELEAELAALADQPDTRQRLFNSLDLGGFATFFAPRSRTFIDDRCELFGGEFLRQYAAAEAGQPEKLQAWADQYDLRSALVRSGSPFDSYLSQSPQWVVVRRAEAAVLYRRQASSLAAQGLRD